MEKITHNGKVKTDTLLPGFVWFSCEEYNVPDNTKGQGFCCVTRPQSTDSTYEGHEHLTPQMVIDAKDHQTVIDTEKEKEKQTEKEEIAKVEAERRQKNKVFGQALKQNPPCPKCGTWCCGECQK